MESFLFYGTSMYGQFGGWIDIVTVIAISTLLFLNIRDSIRVRKGSDIIIQPQLTLFTDDGDKVFVIAVNESQGRYVLYHSRKEGLQLVSRTEFLKLKSSRG